MPISFERAAEVLRDMNAMFRAPMLDALTGVRAAGVRALAPTGKAVLGAYRRLEATRPRERAVTRAELEAELAATRDAAR